MLLSTNEGLISRQKRTQNSVFYPPHRGPPEVVHVHHLSRFPIGSPPLDGNFLDLGVYNNDFKGENTDYVRFYSVPINYFDNVTIIIYHQVKYEFFFIFYMVLALPVPIFYFCVQHVF